MLGVMLGVSSGKHRERCFHSLVLELQVPHRFFRGTSVAVLSSGRNPDHLVSAWGFQTQILG